MAKYVYVTEVTGHGQEKVLDIFKDYEKARDFIIEKANNSIINREDFMYVEKVYEIDGERCTYGVYWNEEPDDDEEFDNEEYVFYVYKKELK